MQTHSLIEIITAFVRASGLRRKDLLCLRRCHIVDDPFSEEILIVYHREGLDRDHIIPILLDHENGHIVTERGKTQQ